MLLLQGEEGEASSSENPKRKDRPGNLDEGRRPNPEGGMKTWKKKRGER